MIIREATEADVQGCNDVWVSTQPGLDAVPIPYLPLSAHELATGRLMVAELDGEVAGFGATLTRSGVLYLADLFVGPAQQSRGLGRQLMQALCGEHRGPLFTFSSADPRARHLYEQFGMRAVEQYHYLDAPFDTLVTSPTDVEFVEARRADVVAIDAEITGRDRLADIDYTSGLGASWYAARRRGGCGACIGVIALAAPTWWNPWHPRGACIGPVLAHDAADVAPILAAALALLTGVEDTPDVVSTFVPSSLAALPALLSAGFQVIDTDLLMASDPALIDRRRYIPTVATP